MAIRLEIYSGIGLDVDFTAQEADGTPMILTSSTVTLEIGPPINIAKSTTSFVTLPGKSYPDRGRITLTDEDTRIAPTQTLWADFFLWVRLADGRTELLDTGRVPLHPGPNTEVV